MNYPPEVQEFLQNYDCGASRRHRILLDEAIALHNFNCPGLTELYLPHRSFIKKY